MCELLKRAKEGDQAAIEEVYANYKGLILSVVNKFYLAGGNKDDLLQEGMLGLYFAILGFDGNKGSFPSFVKLCVVRQIIDAVQKDRSDKNKPLASCLEISAVSNLADGKTPLETLLEKEFSEKIVKIINENLSAKERDVINLFIEGYSYEDISEKLQISYKAVDGAMQRARKKLLQQL